MTTSGDSSRHEQAAQAAQRHLGHPGRMISASKSWYKQAHPNHLCVFNGHLCLAVGGRIWTGDVDVDKDEPRLVALAAELGEVLFVLMEPDALWGNEESPLVDHAVALIHPDRTVEHRRRPIHIWDGDGRRLL